MKNILVSTDKVVAFNMKEAVLNLAEQEVVNIVHKIPEEYKVVRDLWWDLKCSIANTEAQLRAFKKRNK